MLLFFLTTKIQNERLKTAYTYGNAAAPSAVLQESVSIPDCHSYKTLPEIQDK
jgi:hypothetical protein